MLKRANKVSPVAVLIFGRGSEYIIISIFIVEQVKNN
jgi:hypothetical protein